MRSCRSTKRRLFLANPTSNAIYERIGYRRVAESAEIVFV
jgi:predicted GNAT family acetyltransferase